MEIARETVYWSDSTGAKSMKLVRLARAYRSAALKNPKAYILMVGAFPRTSGSAFANYTRSRYVQEMRDGRDILTTCGVWENAIDGYIPLLEAPITEFFYTAVALDDMPRKNPFPGRESMALDELMTRDSSAGESNEPDKMAKYVIVPFAPGADSPTGDTAQTLKAQLEVSILDGAKKRLNVPGEFKVTLELKGGKLKEVGAEWGIVKRKIIDRLANGAISDVQFNFTLGGKQDLTAVSAKKIFGEWSSEAKASIEADLRIKALNKKLHFEIGAKVDNDGKISPVIEIPFD